MYEMKAILPHFDIKLPTSMYKMKNIYLSANTVNKNMNQFNCSEKPPKAVSTIIISNKDITLGATSTTAVSTSYPLDLDQLAAQIRRILKMSTKDPELIVLRQQKLLNQLNDLKLQLAKIRSNLGMANITDEEYISTPTYVDKSTREESAVQDIVINANPKFIPYSLLALKNAWKDLYNLEVVVFTHSTVSDIKAEVKAFEGALKHDSFNPNQPKLRINLIWKNCENTEMISSPTMCSPIYDEVNIVRYLGRVGPKEYRYETSPRCNDIDAVLDVCYQLIRGTTPRIRSEIIQTLNRRLHNQRYFVGETLTIADIAVHSSLKSLCEISDKQLTPALLAWRHRVAQVTLI